MARSSSYLLFWYPFPGLKFISQNKPYMYLSIFLKDVNSDIILSTCSNVQELYKNVRYLKQICSIGYYKRYYLKKNKSLKKNSKKISN